jgi:SAM-dependent methyltransferase
MDSNVWNEAYENDDAPQEVDPVLVAETSELTPGSALDLGCGAGANAVYLAEQGWDVLGIDFAPDGVRMAIDLAEKKQVAAEFLVADTTTWKAPHEFDLVIVMYALPGGEATPQVMATALGALAPGGTLIALDFARDSVGGTSFFDPDELTTTAEIVEMLPGLEVLRAENIDVTHHCEREAAAAGHGAEPGGPGSHTHEGHGHGDPAAWPQGALVRARRPL